MPVFPVPEDLEHETALGEIHNSIWTLLALAADGSGGGWRLPVLGTTDGSRCQQRSIVVRMIDRSSPALLFHSDIRSAKIKQIRREPNVSLLFYDHDLATQLKVSGTATVHAADEIADRLWAASSTYSLRTYTARLPPGTRLDRPAFPSPTSSCGGLPGQSELEFARANFCGIRMDVRTMEWLRLSREGNLRAAFHYVEGVLAEATWIAP